RVGLTSGSARTRWPLRIRASAPPAECLRRFTHEAGKLSSDDGPLSAGVALGRRACSASNELPSGVGAAATEPQRFMRGGAGGYIQDQDVARIHSGGGVVPRFTSSPMRGAIVAFSLAQQGRSWLTPPARLNAT